MPKFQFQYEIMKLFDTKIDALSKEKTIDLDKNFARYVQDNFDQIERYLNKKLLGEDWTDWTPTYSGGGDMTYTSVSTNVGKYIILNEMVYFMLSAVGITGGTAYFKIFFTTPTEMSHAVGGGCTVIDTGRISGYWEYEDSTKIKVCKYDTSNFGLGTVRALDVQGFYKKK